MFSKFLNSKTKTITFAAVVLGVSALFSQILAILRNNLLATSLPNSQTDIYFAAFRIPDFIYGILITGGIVASFLPVFSYFFKKSKEQAQELFNNVLFVFLTALIVICSISAIFAPQLVKLAVPGFSAQDKALTVTLMRIMFLSPLLLGVSAIFSGVLHYFNLFFAYALVPIFYNVGIITGILLFYPIFGLPGLALGVILGAFLHLIIQIPPVIKYGLRIRPAFNLKFPGLRRIFKLMLPRTLGSAAYHVNLIVITAIASTLSIGAISIFNYANHLYGVPVSLIGISFATAVFPVLSRNFANKEKEEFLKHFSSVFSQILFFIIPLSAILFLLRAHLVRLLYGTSIVGNGYFGWWETRLTAASLGIFVLSLFAAALVPFLARTFFSVQDTKTPVKIALVGMALNICLSYFLVWSLSFPNFFQKTIIDFLKLKTIGDIAVIGLPLALSISTIFQFILLCFYLKRKILSLNFKQIYASLIKILISALIMAVLVYVVLQLGSLIFNTKTVLGLLMQIALSLIFGMVGYVLFAIAFKSKEPEIIWSSIKAQFKRN